MRRPCAAPAPDLRPAVRQVEVADIQAQHLGGPRHCLVQQPPQRLLAQGDVLAGQQGFDVGAGQRSPTWLSLSDDPTAADPGHIADLQVLATLVDGQCRYDSGAAGGPGRETVVVGGRDDPR